MQLREKTGHLFIMLQTMGYLLFLLIFSHLKIAQLLLENGADKTIKDNFRGRTPLSVAEYRQFHELVKLLGGNRNYFRDKEKREFELFKNRFL